MSLDIEGVHNLAPYKLGIRQLMSVLPYMDCVVSPDTGIMHMCDALGIQCVSLFGSMIGKLYTEKYDSTLIIVQGECVFGKLPCFYEVCEGRANYQPCMSSIKPDYVMDIIDNVISSGFPSKFNQVSTPRSKFDLFDKIGIRA
jgi:ADP-heptose:LPS heptosyltransferase